MWRGFLSNTPRLAALAISNLAEEEGFNFTWYEGGIRWYALVRYIESIDSKGFKNFTA
jgi:hypothetical protein